jgi:leucyl aminopeptidase (aminopeptidase T)
VDRARAGGCVALAEAAYRAGAYLVDVAYDDRRLRAARVRYGSEASLGVLPDWTAKRLRAQVGARSAVAMIRGEADADVFEGVDAKRLAEDFVRPLRRLA